MLQTLIKELFPIATIITPNVPEASLLLNGKRISSISDMEEAAKELHAMGPQYVLLKGGHLVKFENEQFTSPQDDRPTKEQMVVDILYDGRQCHRFAHGAFRTNNSHGTGCTLAASIAANLAKGYPVVQAVAEGIRYLTGALGIFGGGRAYFTTYTCSLILHESSTQQKSCSWTRHQSAASSRLSNYAVDCPR